MDRLLQAAGHGGWHRHYTSELLLSRVQPFSQSAKLFLQSSELGLPQPLTRRRVCNLPPPPPGSCGRGTLAGETGVGRVESKGVGPSKTLARPGWKQPDIPVKVDTARLHTSQFKKRCEKCVLLYYPSTEFKSAFNVY